MAAQYGYTYRSGPQQFKKELSTAAIITAGDGVMYSTGYVLTLTTGTKCEGVAMETITAAATRLQIMLAQTGRTRFRSTELRAASALAATNVGLLCQTAGTTGAMGHDTSVVTHKDIYIDSMLTAGATGVGVALIAFADPTWISHATV